MFKFKKLVTGGMFVFMVAVGSLVGVSADQADAAGNCVAWNSGRTAHGNCRATHNTKPFRVYTTCKAWWGDSYFARGPVYTYQNSTVTCRLGYGPTNTFASNNTSLTGGAGGGGGGGW